MNLMREEGIIKRGGIVELWSGEQSSTSFMGGSCNDICHIIHKTVYVLLFYVFASTKVKIFFISLKGV